MRILIYTGKGGVGKTSIAAATALKLSKEGKKVLILSTDQAHSLGESYDTKLANMEREIAPNLFAAEIDLVEESFRAWGNIRDYVKQIISDKANDGIAADEVLRFPGLDEAFALLRILDAWNEGSWDVVVVDCAPTGETLSLLSYPEKLTVLGDRIMPMLQSVTRGFGGLISRATSVPKPRDAVFEEFSKLTKRLNELQAILRNRDVTTMRIVSTPERIVLDEARRSFTWISEFDFGVDAVYINRIYPKEALVGYFDEWNQVQENNLKIAKESFPGRKLFSLPLQSEELRGQEKLFDAANQLYGDSDPSVIYCKEPAFTIEDEAGTRYFCVHLPYAKREEIAVKQDGTNLILRVRNEARRFCLPDRVNRRKVTGCEFRDGVLRIAFDYD